MLLVGLLSRTDWQMWQIPEWQFFLRRIDDYVRTGTNRKHGLLTWAPWCRVLRCQRILQAQLVGPQVINIFHRDLGLLRKKFLFLEMKLLSLHWKRKEWEQIMLLSRYSILSRHIWGRGQHLFLNKRFKKCKNRSLDILTCCVLEIKEFGCTI